MDESRLLKGPSLAVQVARLVNPMSFDTDCGGGDSVPMGDDDPGYGAGHNLHRRRQETKPMPAVGHQWMWKQRVGLGG